ncbi:YqgE/AlgH family protein [Maricaulis sp.]|uniref:YqgE/AlgH family protein n=1 Tax=Maricaulis sp. TaxID=1486257 RepID=UPI00261319D4|nr:YqgE/AlgH family protein [Maricaulis sp.]
MTLSDDTHVADRFLGGKLLIATPMIGDPRFDRSVILMCDHSDEHAMGIIINKPVSGLRLPELFDQLGIETDITAPDRAVLLGGPVERDRGFVLHSNDFAADGSTLPVSEGIGLTATKDILEAIASDHPPRRSVLALGYAGWGPGQLEDELTANAWLVADPDEALIFSDTNDDKWEKALAIIGISPEHLSSLSGHA